MSAAQLDAFRRPNDRLRRRRAVNLCMQLLGWLAAALGVALLLILIWSVARQGWSKLSLDLFTKPLVPYAGTGVSEGLANAFVGSLVIVGIATAIALPFGILVAIYVNEFAPRAIRSGVGLVLDVLNGIPAIVIGVFIYGLIVLGRGQSAFAGSCALAVIMLPLVARSTTEILALVPNSLREAALGLGSPRWRATLGIVVPQAMGGILTGATLAVARVAGETAPLLLTSSIVGQGVQWNPRIALESVPVAIYELTDSPIPSDHALAWAGAFVLIMFILVTSLIARWFATRSRRKLVRAGR
jgi:phosphate transport system permease protein